MKNSPNSSSSRSSSSSKGLNNTGKAGGRSQSNSMKKKTNNKDDALTDLWTENGGTAASIRPQPVKTSATWSVDPDVLPAQEAAPRVRKVPVTHPNKRAAVALPDEGQSYNPNDADHQQLLKKAVAQVNKKQRAHDKFVKQMTDTSGTAIKRGGSSSLVNDKPWEDEEVNDGAKEREKRHMEARKGQRPSQKKKKVSLATRTATRKSLHHRRHPDRDAAIKGLEDVEAIKDEVDTATAKAESRAIRKKLRRADGQEIGSFGRYHYHAGLIDVARSDQVVGNLRHISTSGAAASHLAADRLRSLEERNLIPAHQRHSFNKRKILKPKGEVMIKKERFGRMPDPDDHSLPNP